MSLNFLIIIFKKLFKLRSNLYLKLIIWKTKELMFESDIAQNI